MYFVGIVILCGNYNDRTKTNQANRREVKENCFLFDEINIKFNFKLKDASMFSTQVSEFAF